MSALIQASQKRDLKAVRAMMVEKFEWSFGGDEDADQAIEEWTRDARYLRELVRVLGMGCRPKDAHHIECPGRGGLTFRAGLLKVGSAWKLEYFVEGD